VLVVVPPEPAARACVGGAMLVAGLPLLRRIVLAGMRAGFDAVLVHRAAGPADVLAGTPAALLSPEASWPRTGRRVVILPANVVPQPRWLRSLREAALAPEAAYVDSSLTTVIDTADPGRVLAAAMASRGADEVAAALRGGLDDPPGLFDAAGRFSLAAPADVAAAERWLLQSLVKQSEGFMSRHVERRISLAITRRLVATRITPDAMTLVSVAVGLAGAPFFLSVSPAWQLTGALLFLAHSILDGCDGELARLKFMESRRGAVLDFWGDNLVHVAVFGCIAVGWSLAIHAAWPLVLGAVTIASTLASAACVFRRTMQDVVPGAGAAATDRIAAAMAHRDFIYLVVVLSAVGRVTWFLVLATVGTPIFLVLLLWVGAARRPA
jgi:phosphatidylglycerophosphate synthase